MKPKLLIVSDSPFLDTGFGRVAREIGCRLHETQQFDVTYFGWYHEYTDRVIPCRVIPTDRSSMQMLEYDKYGQYSYDKVIEDVKPDIVLLIGDPWMVDYAVLKPRNHKLVGYVPIDSVPIPHKWMKTFAAMDQLVVYGPFGANAVHQVVPEFPLVQIPHGVDTSVFRPSSEGKRGLIGGDAKKFVIGCVGRNSARKNLPRLLKAYKQFINPATSCCDCGHVGYENYEQCPQCGSQIVIHTPEKNDTVLYLHCVANDPHGFDLISLIQRYNLLGRVGIPDHITVARGISDLKLAELYNEMDVFTLPTAGEGWGLPILEAMACGKPVLVTDYSAHVDFVANAGETIVVSEFETSAPHGTERALVDIDDYVMKLDRFYYEPIEFIKRWGPMLRVRGGLDDKQLANIGSGNVLRKQMGKTAYDRGRQYNWDNIIPMWTQLFNAVLGGRKVNANTDDGVLEVV